MATSINIGIQGLKGSKQKCGVIEQQQQKKKKKWKGRRVIELAHLFAFCSFPPQFPHLLIGDCVLTTVGFTVVQGKPVR